MDKKKVLIIDTCLLCVWLQVPNKEVSGPDNDRWDYDRVKAKIEFEIEAGTLLVMPLASIIETGNHVSHIENRIKQQFVDNFSDMIVNAIQGKSPWLAFRSQSRLWDDAHIQEVVEKWKQINQTGEHAFGDVSILDVATTYRTAGFDVEILTSDLLLKSYESVDLTELNIPAPRRRKAKK